MSAGRTNLSPVEWSARESWRPDIGDVVADRFVIKRLAAEGGMGSVYEAADRLTGGPVALKVAHGGDGALVERFRQEASILAGLSHPAIVRHVESGLTPRGHLFLAMEWLKGVDLSTRLARERLSQEQATTMISRACEGLAIAHSRGIVHRDIKPSNLFLVDGDPARVKLLDFGIARFRSSSLTTRAGAMLGTVGYMSPEQARGSIDVDARADVFALGCVFFECLTGRPAFSSEHDVAVLVKVLMEDPPSVGRLVPDIDPGLDALVARMMAKDPAARPSGATAVLAELERWSARGAAPPRSEKATPSKSALSSDEQHFVSIALVWHSRGGSAGQTLLAADHLAPIHDVIEQFGGELASLADGVLVATHLGRGSARDRAARAAACVLAIRDAFPIHCAALASGSAETVGKMPVGPVIDRAAALLEQLAGREGAPVAIDAVTSSLIDARFVVHEAGPLRLLRSERSEPDAPRTLLGRLTPFLGRDRELAILGATADECFTQSIAHAVLVRGPPGIGKSRLRSEFVSRVRAKHESTRVLLARSPQVGAGSSLTLARQLVRRAAGIREGAEATEQQGQLRGYLGKFLREPELQRFCEFLSELLGAPSPENPSPQLRAARNDPRLMSEWMRRSFEDWLEAECRQGPVLLVLDDLHWADLASVAFLESALRRFPESPLMILGLARPEIYDTFPRLRGASGVQEILLGGLTRRAADQIVRTALAEQATDDVAGRIVKLAEGNAFYLEELVRCVAGGEHERLPETVVGMAQARLEALEPEARHVLRAASIFGEVFWAGAVGDLVGESMPEAGIAACLQALVEREFLVVELSDKFLGEAAYAFRHALLREAAYALLTGSDRAAGHGLAARWLERAGEPDPLVIADHLELGGDPERAVPWLLRAAEVAANGANSGVAVQIARRGLSSASSETRGMFREIEQLGLAFQGAWADAAAAAAEAMALLPAGSTPWLRSAGSRMVAAIYLGNPSAVLEVLRASAVMPKPEASGPFGMAMSMLIASLLHAGARPQAVAFVEKLEEAARTQPDPDPAFAGWLRVARSTTSMFLRDEVGPALTSSREALRCFDNAADAAGHLTAKMDHGIALVEAGSFEDGKTLLAEVAGTTHRMMLPTADFAKYYLARVEALHGATERAETMLGALPGLADGARGFLADAHLRRGRVAEAEDQARRIESSMSVYARAAGLSVLARLALQRGQADKALSLADLAVKTQDEGSIVPFWRSIVLLTRIEALLALGRTAAADTALRDACDRIARIEAGFTDPKLRASFVSRLEANAATLALARERFPSEVQT